jgi:hypothetical protein
MVSDMSVERTFKIKHPEDLEVKVLIEPATIRFALGPFSKLHWHDAERFAMHLKEWAVEAKLLADLARPKDPASACTVCGESFREGVVTMAVGDDSDRRRHVEGSPECRR